MGSTYKANSDEHEIGRPKGAYVHRRHFETDNNIRIQGQQSTVIDSVGYPRVDPYDYIERFRERHNIYIYTRPRRHEGSYRWYGGGGGVHQPLKSGRHGSLLNTEFNFIPASDSQGIEDDVIYLCINIVLPGSN